MTTEADRLGPAARTGVVTMEATRSLETHLASLTALRDVCASIDRRLARVEEVSGQSDRAAIDEALNNVCSQMSDRLVRVEAAVQRTEGFVSEKPWDLSTIAHTRLEYVEDTLRLTQQSLANSTLPEICASIDRQLVQARMALQRTEEAVADKTLHELCKNIDARLERTENTLHRREGMVAEWLQELSARMTVRFAEAEETIQRIERIVSRRTGEQTPAQQPSVPHATSESREPENGGFVNVKQMNRLTRLPRMARLAVPALVLVAAFAIGALITSGRDVPPEKVVPLTTNQISIPAVVPATNEGIRAPSTTALMATAPRSTRESGVSAPQQRSAIRASAPTTTPPRFVGTLSITSVPSGASVSLNGKPAGVTPLKLPRQRAGSVAVQVRHDGFEGWSAAVLVPADQLTHVTAKLRASAR